MPKGPKGQTRPADAIGCAVHVAKIATGEIEDEGYAVEGRRKSGLAGAKARTESLSVRRRKEIAALAAKTRWRKETTMDEMMENISRNLFPEDGMRAVDVKFSVGGYSNISARDLLTQISEANEQIASGDATLIEDVDADLTAHL